MEVVTMRDTKLEEDHQSFLKKEEGLLQLQQTANQNLSPPPPPPTTASPPSSSSSPTHEFSFTISLHPHPPPKSTHDHKHNINFHNLKPNSATTSPPPPPPSSLAAIDLSPADDIFFHGHLLPLHLLSHLPVSPRSSTNSMDSFTLPIKDILNDQNNPIGNTSFHHYHHRQNNYSDFDIPSNNGGSENRPKSKSFSLFGRPKWKKDERERERDEEDRERNHNYKKKLKLEVTQAIKRYMKMVRPLLSFPKVKRSSTEFNRQPYSFSGNLLSSRSSGRPAEMMKRGGGGRRGEFSAPASMRTSPGNSGILLGSGTATPTKSYNTSDSTMEELQAAIQAAIAHCKNSIAMEDKIQSKN